MNNPWENEKHNCFPELEAICPRCGHCLVNGEHQDLECSKCGAEYRFNDAAWRKYHFNIYGEVIGYEDFKNKE